MSFITILKNSIDSSDVGIWQRWKNSQEDLPIFQNINFHEFVRKPLHEYDFSQFEFHNCKFENLQLVNCNFQRTEFHHSTIYGTASSFRQSNFKNARFLNVTFSNTGFTEANFSNCLFEDCKLEALSFYGASLVKSKFLNSSIRDCDIFGANIWSIETENTEQKDLRMPFKEGGKNGQAQQITIDDIELANIVYLLAANSNFANFVDESKSRFVLILGRFNENMQRLNAIKDKLRDENYSPIIFDFKSPYSLDLIEVIVLLSLLSRFIIVDLSEPKSVPAELQSILSTLMIPVVPILQRNSAVYGTYTATNRYVWVLPVLVFDDISEVIKMFRQAIIDPAEKHYRQIIEIKNKNTSYRDVNDMNY